MTDDNKQAEKIFCPIQATYQCASNCAWAVVTETGADFLCAVEVIAQSLKNQDPIQTGKAPDIKFELDESKFINEKPANMAADALNTFKGEPPTGKPKK